MFAHVCVSAVVCVCVCLPVDPELFHLMLTKKRCVYVCVCASGRCFFMQVSMDCRGVRELSVCITIKVSIRVRPAHMYIVSVKVLHTTRFVSVKHSQIHHPCFLLALGFLAGSALPLKPADVLTLP